MEMLEAAGIPILKLRNSPRSAAHIEFNPTQHKEWESGHRGDCGIRTGSRLLRRKTGTPRSKKMRNNQRKSGAIMEEVANESMGNNIYRYRKLHLFVRVIPPFTFY